MSSNVVDDLFKSEFIPPDGLFTLQILIKEGKLYRNTELFSEMDPFLVLRHNKKKYRTGVIEKGGRHPVWNETLTIPNVRLSDEVNIECFDEDLIMDDCVGQAKLTV